MTRGGKPSRGRDTARTRAVAVLREVLEKGARATALLSERERGLAEADRGLLRELVLGVLRWKDALDAEIAGMSRVPLLKLAPNLREILEVGLYQIRHLDRVPDYAAVSEAVEHARASGGEGAARLVNGVLRGILLLPSPPPPGEGRGEGTTAAAADLARHFSHPLFLVERWRHRLGHEATRRILEADNRPSGLDLMANPRRADRAALAAALAAGGVRTQPSALSPLALTVLAGNPFASPLFAAGHFSVQDAGSQALPLLLPRGETLLDLAAAPGGKSFAALLLGRCRRSLAADLSVARLTLVEENRRRLDLFEVWPVAGDLLAPPFSPGRFECVLLDAPCSGTGTLRKNPEIRYRVTPEAIERLALQQERFLVAAAELLSPGGYLLYSTCSLEEEENDRVVSRVLARDSGLSLADIQAPPGLAPFVEGARFRLLPDETADGFTAHLLRRR